MYEADEMDSSVVLTQQDSLSSGTQTDAMPLVSVIIPAYNAEKYVEAAVRSMMSQTYRNLEILVTDDCSTDGTLAILNRLAAEDARVRVFHNEQNKKIVATLNALVSRARGAYIARMDADDISLPQRIQKQVAFLESHPDISICGTNAWHIDERGRRIGKTHLPITPEENRFFLKFYSTFYHPTVMCRAEVYKKNLYSEEFLYAEDYELWCRLIFAKNQNGVNLKERLFEYRVFSSQSSTTHFSEQAAASAKIFSQYKIVKTDLAGFHKNIFFEHASPLFAEIGYCKKIFTELSHKKITYAYPALKKLMFHLFKLYKKTEILPFCMNWYGFVTCLKVMTEKTTKSEAIHD